MSQENDDRLARIGSAVDSLRRRYGETLEGIRREIDSTGAERRFSVQEGQVLRDRIGSAFDRLCYDVANVVAFPTDGPHWKDALFPSGLEARGGARGILKGVIHGPMQDAKMATNSLLEEVSSSTVKTHVVDAGSQTKGQGSLTRRALEALARASRKVGEAKQIVKKALKCS
jgi:hypothetical protein